MAIDFTLTDGQKNNAEGHAIGAMSKVLCGELMFSSIFRAMQAMGVNALDKKHPVERFMRESLVFPCTTRETLACKCGKFGESC
jgi:alkylation response protein AidB-like acyl-CoA dehydrogenase